MKKLSLFLFLIGSLFVCSNTLSSMGKGNNKTVIAESNFLEETGGGAIPPEGWFENWPEGNWIGGALSPYIYSPNNSPQRTNQNPQPTQQILFPEESNQEESGPPRPYVIRNDQLVQGAPNPSESNDEDANRDIFGLFGLFSPMGTVRRIAAAIGETPQQQPFPEESENRQPTQQQPFPEESENRQPTQRQLFLEEQSQEGLPYLYVIRNGQLVQAEPNPYGSNEEISRLFRDIEEEEERNTPTAAPRRRTALERRPVQLSIPSTSSPSTPPNTTAAPHASRRTRTAHEARLPDGLRQLAQPSASPSTPPNFTQPGSPAYRDYMNEFILYMNNLANGFRGRSDRANQNESNSNSQQLSQPSVTSNSPNTSPNPNGQPRNQSTSPTTPPAAPHPDFSNARDAMRGNPDFWGA